LYYKINKINIYYKMLKTFLFFSKIAILLSQHHILNIEQGENNASKYLDSIPYKWGPETKNPSNESKDITAGVNEPVTKLFEYWLGVLGPNMLPEISIYNTENKTKQYSYNFAKCDNCLLFDYIDQTKKDPSVDCTFTYPGREFKAKEITDDQYKFDKILNQDDYSIILKGGKIYLTQHDGEEFIQYHELSKKLDIFKGKVFIDVLSFMPERLGFDKMSFLCHTEEEIIIFDVMNFIVSGIADSYVINKAEKDLKFNTITAFSNSADSVVIVYSHLDFGMAVIKKKSGEVEKLQIFDNDKKALDIHDAKFAAEGKYVYIVVKSQGFHAYNMSTKEITSFSHPYLTQIDKYAQGAQYIGVYVDQEQKDVKEVLIEFVFKADEKKIYLNKAYTTLGLRFQKSLIASTHFYVLFAKDTMYLLPAREYNFINTLGAKITIDAGDNTTVTVIESLKGDVYVVRNQANSKLFYKKKKNKKEKKDNPKDFTCIFTQPGKYSINLVEYENTSGGLKANISAANIIIIISSQGFPLWLILLISGLAVFIIIAIGCYLRQRKINAIAQPRNAHLL
jgi:hypothetical protein